MRSMPLAFVLWKILFLTVWRLLCKLQGNFFPAKFFAFTAFALWFCPEPRPMHDRHQTHWFRLVLAGQPWFSRYLSAFNGSSHRVHICPAVATLRTSALTWCSLHLNSWAVMEAGSYCETQHKNLCCFCLQGPLALNSFSFHWFSFNQAFCIPSVSPTLTTHKSDHIYPAGSLPHTVPMGHGGHTTMQWIQQLCTRRAVWPQTHSPVLHVRVIIPMTITPS